MFSWEKLREVVKSAVAEDMTLEQFRAEMLQLSANESVNHYRMGQLYNHVSDKKLAEAAGYDNTQDYIVKELPDLSYASLRMYGAVAAGFNESIAVRFGVTCLYLLLTYKEVADLDINHEEPGPTIIEVPGENGEVTSKSFSGCSVEDMRKAIQRKRKPASSKPLPPEDVALAGQYQKAVTDQFPKGVVVKVQVRNQKGKAVLDIKGIPVGQVDTLVAALTASSVPTVSEKQRVEKAPPTA